MPLLIGIDEAGYGPLLGPLVVSAVAVSVPKGLVSADLWQVLSRSVTRVGRSAKGKLVIDDSKVVFKRRSGIRSLERSVLAAILASGQRPRTLQQMLSLLDGDCLSRLSNYPWHKDMDARRLPCEEPVIELAANTLARDLARNDAALVAIRCRCLDVAHYNQMVERLHNKATLLFCVTCGLIKQIMDLSEQQEVICLVDRQGGRSYYRARLQTMFPDCSMKVVREDQQQSCYELAWPCRRMQVQFAVGADALYLPVALASMVSKYLRELLLDDMNAYFARLLPDLRPTSGYWQDGMRFLDQLANSPGLEIQRHLLVRSR